MFSSFSVSHFFLLYFCLQLCPTDELPEFKIIMKQLFDECSRISLKLLEMMGLGLQLPVSEMLYLYIADQFKTLSVTCMM